MTTFEFSTSLNGLKCGCGAALYSRSRIVVQICPRHLKAALAKFEAEEPK